MGSNQDKKDCLQLSWRWPQAEVPDSQVKRFSGIGNWGDAELYRLGDLDMLLVP
jgi:hypothetical protein